MKNLIAEGRTIFFSSHILSDIDEICDRIGVIHDQKLQYLGTPAGFKQQAGTDSLEHAFLKVINQE
jgi:ABC-2 type transport system ATP-binding protein